MASAFLKPCEKKPITKGEYTAETVKPEIFTIGLITEKVRSRPKPFVCGSTSAVTYVSEWEGQEIRTDEVHRLVAVPAPPWLFIALV